MYTATPCNLTRTRASSDNVELRLCNRVISVVSRQKNVPRKLFKQKGRGQLAAARARQLAMYLSHVVMGCTLTEIGQAFGRDRTTVSYACALVEDMRDDLRFDSEVCALEELLQRTVLNEEMQRAA